MLKISEKDLYTFVFYQDNLSTDKVSFIKNNRHLFEAELTLLQEIKDKMAFEVDDAIVDKINSKIENRQHSVIIKLEKLVIENNNNHLILAADSPEDEKKSRTDTFKDKDNNYLGKVLTTDKMNRIYIFKNYMQEIQNMTITLIPSQQKYSVSSADLPLVITPPQFIEKLELEF